MEEGLGPKHGLILQKDERPQRIMGEINQYGISRCCPTSTGFLILIGFQTIKSSIRGWVSINFIVWFHVFPGI